MATSKCDYSGIVSWQPAGDREVHYMAAMTGIRPQNIKRGKVVCPKCKRRLRPSVSYCHDGCCIYYSIPAGHKVKGWWKR